MGNVIEAKEKFWELQPQWGPSENKFWSPQGGMHSTQVIWDRGLTGVACGHKNGGWNIEKKRRQCQGSGQGPCVKPFVMSLEGILSLKRTIQPWTKAWFFTSPQEAKSLDEPHILQKRKQPFWVGKDVAPLFQDWGNCFRKETKNSTHLISLHHKSLLKYHERNFSGPRRTRMGRMG